ncbi:uncharacterized protein MYCFIDRAFT_174356 [Pseudocercospora fijiensis CIRAD86]|uniref:Uncharacterized protein n=1 Tax=Pseudocercospora fijiensis (strain CIRAD86) TaxID=383855 RepID=M3AE50_PSEFD|nr:uncharacterized protein MYCFIDRAFT_174356 [Pseudocercospora fijiensis CIRAD86]EME82826.1 hypothetical protein MYCFIDRAFT_174356 [Pseudocercospora fijiensis CIRAD86]
MPKLSRKHAGTKQIYLSSITHELHRKSSSGEQVSTGNEVVSGLSSRYHSWQGSRAWAKHMYLSCIIHKLHWKEKLRRTRKGNEVVSGVSKSKIETSATHSKVLVQGPSKSEALGEHRSKITSRHSQQGPMKLR